MAILTYDLLWQIFETIRDNCAPEYELACIAELGLESLETLLRQYFVSEIETVVGTDFGDETLTIAMLVERFEILPTITSLEETYSVILAGTGGQTLGQWLSNPVADLSLIETISQAVEATAQALYAQITAWSDPNTGYLRGGITVSAYLDDLRNAGSASAAFQLVADDGSPLVVILAPSAYAADPLKLFGYLNGWPYAGFARRVIQIDRDIYDATYHAEVASRLWNSQNWLPTANALLRTDWTGVSGFTDRGITSIDPIHSLSTDSPYDLIIAYRARTTICTPAQEDDLCHEDCYVQAVKDQTDGVENWAWAGSPRSGVFLPFLPKSIITGCTPARRGLARGIIALWSEVGIYQNYEDVARLVNALEHTNTLTSQAARVALLQFLHFVYHTTDTTFASREVEYIAAMTSAILDYDNIVGVDERIYKYLMDMLTPVAEQTDTDYAVEYATEPLGFAWETFDTNLYTPPIRDAIAVGANRTFGSTEFNTLSEASRTLLINQKQNGTGAGGWTSFAPFESEPFITSVGAPDGVFLMTPAQFNYAQDLS